MTVPAVLPTDALPALSAGQPYVPEERLQKEVRGGLILCAVLVFGMGGLSAVLPMAGAVIAPGQVSVASYVKQVGHPSGGVIADVMVRDGDRVTKGQPLLRLDSTVTLAAATYTGENVDQLVARAARLTAERDGRSSVAFPAELTKRANNPGIATLMAQEQRTFALRRAARLAAAAQLDQRMAQSAADRAAASTKASSLRDQAALINDELDATRKLYERRYTTLDRLNALERTASSLSADARGAQESAAASSARIAELRAQRGAIGADARSSAAAELMDVLARVAELRRARAAADDSYDKSVIRAPQAGVIDKLAYRTVGGVIPPGQTVLEIVPDDDRMVVESTVSPVDVDQVREGQPAVIRFSAFSSRTTPELKGHVTHLSADRTDDRNAQTAFYRVTIALDRGELARLDGLRLRPGMPAETFIQTGKRTMLSYILKPLSDQLARAFREN